MLKVVHDVEASNENGWVGGSLLDGIVRDGARAMLAAALQAEVAAYIEAHPPQLVALVRAGATFKKGKLIERPDESGVISKSRDTPIHRS